jgi:hypothetical protein
VAQGYTVNVRATSSNTTYWGTLDATKIGYLNAADLVIVSRCSNSGNYTTDAAEIANWNGVTKPMLLMTAMLARNSRWLWVNSGTTAEAAGAGLMLEAVIPSHPIFTGVSLANNQVDILDETVVTNGNNGNITLINTTNVGNGTLLARSVTATNYTWIAEWNAGQYFYGTSGQMAGGHRMLFSVGASSMTGGYGGRYNLTAAGQKLYLNAVLYMTGASIKTGIALKPTPDNGKTDVLRDADLSWTAGEKAVTHDVYFGINFADVNTASQSSPKGVLVAKGQSATTFDPGILQLGQTYYWRVDEIEQNGTLHQGEVWSFTVEPVAYEVTGIAASASSSDPARGPELTINKSGLNAAGQHGTDATTMWLSAKGGPQPTWIQYDLGKVCKLQEMWVWNYNIDYEFLLGMGVKNTTIQYSTDGTNWKTLGNFDFAQGPSAANYDHNTTVAFGGLAARYVKINVNSGWGTSGQYGLSEVRFYSIPVSAREPNPATGATGIAPDMTLSWRAGREAASHQVFMGTDPNVLTLAGTSATNSFAPANLSLGTKYYWRVDEVNTAQAISTWASDVWNFTTSPFVVVDDMESYNDTINQIFNVWVDGYGTTTNGSVVGLATSANGTFGSTTIFHSGKQSMPLAYNNAGSITNSEATRTFDSIQDWTRNGVKTLTLYFYGQAANITTVPLWVKLTDQTGKNAKVTFGATGEDKLVLADPAWATWNIPLTSFTGVNAAKIKSMTIGLGNGTGSGTLYIDDIRLFPAVTTTTVTPALVGWWKLDNDVKDSSGAGNNGTIVGTPTYVAAGKVGASLKLNGTTDYVDCGNAASLNISDVITLSAWIKPATLANSAYQTFISKGDNAYVLAQSNTNLLQLSIYDTGAWYQANSVAVTTAFNGSWHHVAGTFDGTEIRLYIDGKMASSALRVGAINIDTYVLSLGRNSQQASRLFNGEMDDVRIYHGVLSTSDIVKLANP